MEFKGIVALSKETRTIGLGNELPWPTLKKDLNHFKNLTWDQNIIMGRKTFESLPQGWLNHRTIWVLMRKNVYGWDVSYYQNKHGTAHEVQIFTDIDNLPNREYFVCGGLQIYDLFKDKVNEWYVTYIKKEYKGDVAMFDFEKDFLKTELIMECPQFEIKRIYERNTGKNQKAIMG